MQQIKFSIQSVCPTLMHNSRLANPFDAYTKAMKVISAKKKKTEADQLELARLEFLGGIYYEPTVGVYIPGESFLACFREAAKLDRLGRALTRALMIEEDCIPIVYEGPRTPEELHADPSFVDTRIVRVQATRIARTRPIFREWSCELAVLYDETQLNRDQILKIAEDAGRLIGVNDYRPRFGKFKATALETA